MKTHKFWFYTGFKLQNNLSVIFIIMALMWQEIDRHTLFKEKVFFKFENIHLQRFMHPYVHYSIVHCDKDMETT